MFRGKKGAEREGEFMVKMKNRETLMRFCKEKLILIMNSGDFQSLISGFWWVFAEICRIAEAKSFAVASI